MRQGWTWAVAMACAAAAWGADLDALRLLDEAYPRAFYFRQTEGMAASSRMDYAQWERHFLALDGIMGKCLDEEVPGRSKRNIAFFTRYKQRHPDKAVLLHFNGNARDPRHAPHFAPGHWLYYNGCAVTRDVPQSADAATIHVANPSLFRANIGRYNDKNDDIAICALGPDGRPDWTRAEQLELVAVDPKGKTLTVRRGAFGTTPRAFAAGQAYIAAHVMEGPWGKRSNMLWAYNHSTTCPKDVQGRVCDDLLLADLEAWFGPGGELEAFDGLEFDVLHYHPIGGGGRGADVNADGVMDRGEVDGANVYGAGVDRFLHRLRAAFGPDRIIMADGHSWRGQRSVAALNGIESEGWPTLSDADLVDWSGGLNRHAYWTRHAHPPRLSYINHKFMDRGESFMPPFNITRLVLAAAQFTDTAVTYSLIPERDGGVFGVWDELRAGTAQTPRWLGQPLGPARHLAFDAPDLLEGAGAQWPEPFLARWRFEGVAAKPAGAALTLDGEAAALPRATLTRVTVPEGDLLVRCTVSAAPRAHAEPALPRLVWLDCRASGNLMEPDAPLAVWAGRDGAEHPVEAGGSGAAVQYRPAQRLAGETHEAYFAHPPYGPRQNPGYTVWEKPVRVTADAAQLVFHTGLAPAPNPSDGVVFEVFVVDGGARQRVFSAHQTAYGWQRQTVDLSPWTGRGVRLRFVTDCGPEDHTTADHAYWGDVHLEGADQPFQRGPYTARRIMTWAGADPFEATFYFRDVGPSVVDLRFEWEGPEPLHIEDLRLYNAPDAMVRRFEHGAVLANPGMQPYTFNIEEICPGQTFRRIEGVAQQDPAVNTGQRVQGPVTLDARDALFLRDAQ